MQNSLSTVLATREVSGMLPLAAVYVCALIASLLGGCGTQTMSNNSPVQLEDSGVYVCDNPSLELLRKTLESQRSSTDSFFILSSAEECFLQGALNASGFHLEYQEGSPHALYAAQNRQSLDATLRIADAYVRGDTAWKQMCEWERRSK